MAVPAEFVTLTSRELLANFHVHRGRVVFSVAVSARILELNESGRRDAKRQIAILTDGQHLPEILLNVGKWRFDRIFTFENCAAKEKEIKRDFRSSVFNAKKKR